MDNDLLLPVLRSLIQNIQANRQGASPAKTNNTAQDFQSLFLMAFGGPELTASNPASLLMPFLGGLNEQLLAFQLQNSLQTGLPASMGFATGQASLSGAERLLHINQFDAEIQVGGNGANSNCGPTSLVMALHRLGLRVAGETEGTSSGEAVDLARRSMASSFSVDGVNESGLRVDSEHNAYTNFDDLARGASAAGARSERISPSAPGIIQALESGASIIVSGTFNGKSPLPWTGDRGPDNQSAPGNAGKHIIEISAYDPASGLFTIHDPARKTPNQVSAAGLQAFMAGNAGAIAIRREGDARII